VGFQLLDLLAERFGLSFRKPFLKPFAWARMEIGGADLVMVKPLTFVNRSGDIFPEILERIGAGPGELLVACDTLDLPVGQCRLRRRGSSAGHRGLASIIRRLGREDFMRLYIGIGRPRDPGQVVAWVLGRPGEREAEAIGESLLRAADAVIRLLSEDPEKVMNGLNQKSPEP
jgi:PTH1 family peptidyl-tRNA hydrolase